jgi:hypothetical protein
MGIMVAYIDPDKDAQRCSALPSDIKNLLAPGSIPGRTGGPVPFKVPLTGLDENGNGVKIRKPPGKTSA